MRGVCKIILLLLLNVIFKTLLFVLILLKKVNKNYKINIFFKKDELEYVNPSIVQ